MVLRHAAAGEQPLGWETLAVSFLSLSWQDLRGPLIGRVLV